MTEKDLIIGNKYTFKDLLWFIVILEGFDSEGNPLLRPIHENNKHFVYNENIVKIKNIDQKFIGCYTEYMDMFLDMYIELNSNS